MTTGNPEIRRNPDQSIDEIVAKDVKCLHIEQMSNDSWYMGIDMPDGSYHQFWFGSKNRKSHVEFRHTESCPSGEVTRILDVCPNHNC